MHFAVAAVLVGAAGLARASDCINEGGNFFCSETKHIVYNGLGNSGSYSRVTNMGNGPDDCSFADTPFSSSIGPLDEEVCFCAGKWGEMV